MFGICSDNKKGDDGMRQEIKDLMVNAKIEEHFNFGLMDGEQFIVVDSYEAIEKLEKLISDSGIESDGAEAELGEWGYDDEYHYCTCCYEFIRTSPKYNGQPNDYVIIGRDCIDYYCLPCVKDNFKTQYIEERINNADNAIERNGIVNDADLENMGFSKQGAYSAGWNYGMSDAPQEVIDRLAVKHDDIIFIIDDYTPFDTHYSAWVRN
jgi:hypothetical protein